MRPGSTPYARRASGGERGGGQRSTRGAAPWRGDYKGGGGSIEGVHAHLVEGAARVEVDLEPHAGRRLGHALKRRGRLLGRRKLASAPDTTHDDVVCANRLRRDQDHVRFGVIKLLRVPEEGRTKAEVEQRSARLQQRATGVCVMGVCVMGVCVMGVCVMGV